MISGTRGSRAPRARQLPLELGLAAGHRFANFEPGPNCEVLAIVRRALDEPRAEPIYLWGAPGCGKTHLLEACCAEIAARGESLAYVPLRDLRLSPAMLAGLASVALVAVDDIDRVAGDPGWEEALFHLYNQCEQSAAVLLVGAARAASQVSWGLADLGSRLAACLSFRLRVLDDAAPASAASSCPTR